MVKVIVMYGPPTDPAAFDAHYFDIHVPLAEKIPGLQRFEVSKFASADGSPVTTYLAAELYFDSAEVMGASMTSPEGQAASADVANFATGGVTMLTGEVLKAS